MSTADTAEGRHSHDPIPVQGKARSRDQAVLQRDTAAGRRDDQGERRDLAADERDRAAHRRSDSRAVTDAASGTAADLARAVLAAESDRGHAEVDRVAAANDRKDAATDRTEASADRRAAAFDRRQAGLDNLTGAYNREAGLLELSRDLARSARTGQPLVVAFLDVDHLKSINDGQGHAAGDRALVAVADTLLSVLRAYDLVIRYGGDEFLCAALGIGVDVAKIRFTRVNELLNNTTPGVAVTAGVAELRAGEPIAAVIARADADLYRQRQQRTDTAGRTTP